MGQREELVPLTPGRLVPCSGQHSLGQVGSWTALTVSVRDPVSPVGTHVSVPGTHLGEGHRVTSLGSAEFLFF